MVYDLYSLDAAVSKLKKGDLIDLRCGPYIFGRLGYNDFVCKYVSSINNDKSVFEDKKLLVEKTTFYFRPLNLNVTDEIVIPYSKIRRITKLNAELIYSNGTNNINSAQE